MTHINKQDTQQQDIDEGVVTAMTAQDLKNSVFTVSLAVNLAALAIWIGLQASFSLS